MSKLAEYNKALLLLVVIILVGITEASGVDLGLDIEHYVALLLIDLGIYAIPNKDKDLS